MSSCSWRCNKLIDYITLYCVFSAMPLIRAYCIHFDLSISEHLTHQTVHSSCTTHYYRLIDKKRDRLHTEELYRIVIDLNNFYRATHCMQAWCMLQHCLTVTLRSCVETVELVLKWMSSFCSAALGVRFPRNLTPNRGVQSMLSMMQDASWVK